MWRDFSRAVAEVWRASGEPCSTYRPERHYMRGRGPKWQAKYGSLYRQTVLAKTTPAKTASAHVLRETAEQHA